MYVCMSILHYYRGLSIPTKTIIFPYFPQALPCLDPKMVDTILKSMWKLHFGTTKDETEKPSTVFNGFFCLND